MAIRSVNGINLRPINPETSNLQSGLKSAGQFAGGLLTRAAASPFKLAELPANILGAVTGLTPKQKPISQRIEEGGKQLFGDIEPTNPVSRALQYTAGNLPLALATGGGSVAQKLALDLAGSGGISLAEEFTDNPLLQLGAGFLASRKYNQLSKAAAGKLEGFNKLGNKKVPNQPGYLEGKAKDLTTHFYNQEKELGKVLPHNEKPLLDKLSNLRKEVESVSTNASKEASALGKLSPSDKTNILNNIDLMEKGLTEGIVSREQAAPVLGSLKEVIKAIDENKLVDIRKILPEGRNYSADEIFKVQDAVRKAKEVLKRGQSNPKAIQTSVQPFKVELSQRGVPVRDIEKKSIESMISKRPKLLEEALNVIDPSGVIDRQTLDIKRRPYNASDIFNLKKNLNSSYIESATDKGRFDKRLLSLFHDEIGTIAKDNKQAGEKWLNAGLAADELHKVSKWKSGINEAIQDLSSSGKLERLFKNPGTKELIKTLFGVPATFGLRQISGGAEKGVRSLQFINSLRKTSEGAKLLKEIAFDGAEYATSKKGLSSLASNINKLGKKYEDFEEKPVKLKMRY